MLLLGLFFVAVGDTTSHVYFVPLINCQYHAVFSMRIQHCVISPFLTSPRAHLHVVGFYGLCFWHKPAERAHPFLFCSCICFFLFVVVFMALPTVFHSINFSPQLSDFSLCSFSLTSVLSLLSTIYLFTKVSRSSNIIVCGLGLKHQLTNYCHCRALSALFQVERPLN